MRAGLEQLVAAVPAGVGERVQSPSFVAYQQHALIADADRALVAGLRQVVRSADAHPAGAEEVLPFPREDGIRQVCLGGQCPARARRGREHRPKQRGVDRGTHVGHGWEPSSGSAR